MLSEIYDWPLAGTETILDSCYKEKDDKVAETDGGGKENQLDETICHLHYFAFILLNFINNTGLDFENGFKNGVLEC